MTKKAHKITKEERDLVDFFRGLTIEEKAVVWNMVYDKKKEHEKTNHLDRINLFKKLMNVIGRLQG